MPSRRTLLGAVGTGVGIAAAGCLGLSDRAEGYVQFKSVSGVHEKPGRSEAVRIVDIGASFEPNGEPPELTQLHDDWADRFPVPRAPVVSDDLHAELVSRFDTVRYVVGVTSPDWADDGEDVGSFNVATTRENFNRVQVHDAVTASSDGTYLTIHSVDGLWEFDSGG